MSAGLLLLPLTLNAVVAPAGARGAETHAACLHGATSATNEQAVRLVQAALRSDNYLDDAHIDVTIEHGNIVLRGFVLDEWDMLTALSVSRQAACHRKVVDELSLETGGRR